MSQVQILSPRPLFRFQVLLFASAPTCCSGGSISKDTVRVVNRPWRESRQPNYRLAVESGFVNRDCVAILGAPSRGGRPLAGSTSPSASHRSDRPRGCRRNALPCAWTHQGEQDAATRRGRTPP